MLTVGIDYEKLTRKMGNKAAGDPSNPRPKELNDTEQGRSGETEKWAENRSILERAWESTLHSLKSQKDPFGS